MHARGASVALVDLQRADVECAAAAVGERTLALKADVTDRSAVEAAVAATVERFGGLDVPVANAGIAPPTRTVRSIDPEAFERTIEVDLLGVWRTPPAQAGEAIVRGASSDGRRGSWLRADGRCGWRCAEWRTRCSTPVSSETGAFRTWCVAPTRQARRSRRGLVRPLRRCAARSRATDPAARRSGPRCSRRRRDRARSRRRSPPLARQAR